MASQNNRALSNNEYTVGWICALEKELTAARAVLDNIHSDRPHQRATNDNNTYLLGDLEGHNVVVAVVPAGVYGKSIAASVARDMLRSFENVRVGLMVGIGGGAPIPRNNIHLGDVVVSVPYNGGSGVFQYDFGKTIQDKSFQYTGHLDQPPALLLAAVASLHSRSSLHGNEITKHVDTVLEKYPRLRRSFGRPDAASDRLYVSEFTHQNPDHVGTLQQGCESTCGSTSNNVVDRGASSGWAERYDEPTVFQGIIASADQLMKDASVRDTLSRNHDVLCFEMEAAGLMNNFPCLVVRGICDYSDTHKNDAWQGYAALSAAVYTRQLLGMIAPASVQSERKVVDRLNAIEESLHEVKDTASRTHSQLDDMNTNQIQARLKEWLDPFDPSIYHSKALKQHMTGSGKWLMTSSQYEQWLNQEFTFLWVAGLPGCGKTILSSAIIEHLCKTRFCLYFYITFLESETLSLDGVLSSLMWQLYCRQEAARPILMNLYKNCLDCPSGKRLPRTNELITAFDEMLRLGKETWIVLDALDECLTGSTQANAEELVSWIRDIVRAGHKNLHLLATSRKEDEIRAGLIAIAGPGETIEIAGEGLKKDIKDYVTTKISQIVQLRRWKDSGVEQETWEALRTKLIDTADGAFRYVACQIEELETCLSLGALRRALSNLPNDINDTYSRILTRVLDKYRTEAIRILQLLIYSRRPLRVEELIDAIAVQPGRFETDDRISSPVEIVRCCSSLVKLVGTSHSMGNTMKMELHLAHFTVQEYLVVRSQHTSIFEEVKAKASIALVCISYLRYIKREVIKDRSTRTPRETAFPFMDYCSTSWLSFAAVATDVDETVFEETMGFLLGTETKYFKTQPPNIPRNEEWPSERVFLEACEAGLSVRCLEYLLKHDRCRFIRLNTVPCAEGKADMYSHLYLRAAVRNSDLEAIRFLMAEGANADGGHFVEPCRRGEEEVVELLLKLGGTLEDPREFQGTRAFISACSAGRLRIVEMLIEYHKSFVKRPNYMDSKSPMMAACQAGHEDVALLLLENGASASRSQVTRTTIPEFAIVKGFTRLLGHIIHTYPEVLESWDFRIAVQTGHEDIIRMLWNTRRFDQDDLDEALFRAARANKEDIVRLMLQLGADPLAEWREKSEWQTPLAAAQRGGHTEVISQLREAEGKAQASTNDTIVPCRVSTKHKSFGFQPVNTDELPEHPISSDWHQYQPGDWYQSANFSFTYFYHEKSKYLSPDLRMKYLLEPIKSVRRKRRRFNPQ